MNENKNNIYVNLVREYDGGDKWRALVLEHCRVTVPIKSLDHDKKIKNIDIRIENVINRDLVSEISIKMDEFPNASSIEDIKSIVNEYKEYIQKSLNKVGFYEYDIIFDFYLDYNGYCLEEEEGDDERFEDYCLEEEENDNEDLGLMSNKAYIDITNSIDNEKEYIIIDTYRLSIPIRWECYREKLGEIIKVLIGDIRYIQNKRNVIDIYVNIPINIEVDSIKDLDREFNSINESIEEKLNLIQVQEYNLILET